eukprot:8230632-Ditylum_brightwellii.AAC.1
MHLFPTCLAIPATNFMATFSKIGYMGIQKIFDDNNNNYSNFTISQAFDLKKKLKKLNLDGRRVSIASLDVVNMYPSTRLSLVKQAINHYTRNLPAPVKAG